MVTVWNMKKVYFIKVRQISYNVSNPQYVSPKKHSEAEKWL
jgi:hypothetical protein